jgi:polar amino acid transport system substrate-binding protein
MLVIAGLLVLTGWTGARGVHAAGNHAVTRAGSLVDIINLPYPPMEFSKPGSSTVIGFDIDMATAIAKKLGDSISFQNVLFEQIIPSVRTHRGDFAWTAVFDLKAREKTLSFIDYFKTGSQLYTSAANAGKYKAIKDLCGQTVAVPKGTSFGQVVGRLSKAQCSGSSIKQVTVASPTEQNLQIREGRAAAAISGPETVLYLRKQNPGKWALVGPIVEPDYYAVVFAKSNTKMLNTVFAAMKAAWKDGTYQRILAKWGLSGAAIPQPLINHALH